MNASQFYNLLNDFSKSCRKSGTGYAYEAGYLSSIMSNLFTEFTEEQKKFILHMIQGGIQRNEDMAQREAALDRIGV